MTQAEKDKLHIKKQNRRYRNLICRILAPILFLQLLCSPLYIYMFMLRSAVPSEPVEIVYMDNRWVSGRGIRKHLIITAETGRQYYVLEDGGRPFWEDVRAGKIVPGDRLTITACDWPVYDRIVELRAGDRIYADASDFEESRSGDIRLRLTICAIALGLGALVSLIVYLLERRELNDIRKLHRKYRERMRQGKT
ncbi:MAG: hypothetical protein IKI02_09035 [Oscillospiraceae bacterium]|nr:hypothetical protein [Oscillospiraceae bacterium]